jgi:hypothetical protein
MDCLTCGDRHISTDHRRNVSEGRIAAGGACTAPRSPCLSPLFVRGLHPSSRKPRKGVTLQASSNYFRFPILARVLSFKYPLLKTSTAPAFFVECRETSVNVSGIHSTYRSGCPFLRTLSVISFAITQLHLQAKIPIASGKRTKNAKTRSDCG